MKELLTLLKELIVWIFSKLDNLLTYIILKTKKHLANRVDNKIFVFGLPHSGKSTLTAALIKFLDTDNNYIFRRDPIKNPKGVLVIRDWIQNFYNGEFPLQTPENEFTKINIEYQTIKNNKLNKLSLYEIAGEDVIKFDPTHNEHNNIPPELVNFLKESNGTIITASCEPDRADEEEVIRDFLEYLFRSNYNKPIYFILTKYDLAEKGFQHHKNAIRTIYSKVGKLLTSYNNSYVFAFSVGQVDNNKIINDKSSEYIKKIFTVINEI